MRLWVDMAVERRWIGWSIRRFVRRYRAWPGEAKAALYRTAYRAGVAIIIRAMDRLKVIESFVAVATRGSLTAAAKLEGIAPAVVGRRIDALEERLGVKLLTRTTRRITLTREGGAFLEDCQRLLSRSRQRRSQCQRRKPEGQRHA